MFKTFSTYAFAIATAIILSAQVTTADAAKEKFERTKPHTSTTQGTNSAGAAATESGETGDCEEESREATRTAGGDDTSNDCDPDGSTSNAGSGSGTKYSGNKEAGY